MLKNILGITNEVELSKEEERITKLKALELFDSNKINEIEVGTFEGLSKIHNFLFKFPIKSKDSTFSWIASYILWPENAPIVIIEIKLILTKFRIIRFLLK